MKINKINDEDNTYELLRYNDGKWKTYINKDQDRFREAYLKLRKDIETYEKEVNEILENGDISKYVDKGEDLEEKENALVSTNSSHYLEFMSQQLIEKADELAIMKAFVGKEVERRKEQLNALMNNFRGELSLFKKKIKKLRKNSFLRN